jgi:hypothetical protein
VTKLLKVVQKIRKKMEETEMQSFGISDKEIKLNQKYAKGRKPDKELLAKVKLYLIDPSKLIKDDKTVKLARARFLRKGQPKKPEQSQGSGDIAESLIAAEATGGMAVTIGEDGLPLEKNEDEEGDGEQGEQGEGPDSGLAEARADPDEGMEGEAGSDADEAAGEGEGRSSQQDIHASTTNISQPGDAGEDEDGGEAALTAADSSGNLIIKKKRAVSKSPRKGKRKGPSDAVELIDFGPSKQLKGKLVVGEKIVIPPEVLEHVTANYEEGFDALTPDLAQDLVHQLYVKPQRKKLAGQWEIEKARPALGSWHKLLIHLAYNIQPGKGANEDIEEIKEEAEHQSEDEPNNEGEPNSSTLRNTDGIRSSMNLVKAEKPEEQDRPALVTQPPVAPSGLETLVDVDKQSEPQSSKHSERSRKS